MFQIFKRWRPTPRPEELTPEDIRRWNELLGHKRLKQRLRAVRDLQGIPAPAAVCLLIRALRNSRSEVREAAYAALVHQGELAVEPLIEILKRPYDITQEDLDNALAEYAGYWEEKKPEEPVLKAAEIDSLLRALKEGTASSSASRDALSAPVPEPKDGLDILVDREYKWKAAEILGRIGAPRAVPVLIECLKDPEPWVRGKAAEALGKIGDPAARPALEAVREDGTIRSEVHTAVSDKGIQ